MAVLLREVFSELLLLLFYLVLLVWCAQVLPLHAMVALFPLFFAMIVRFIASKWPILPCESLYHLFSCAGQLLRFCLTLTVLLKLNGHTNWDWSTTFWPYWCSFAIQIIMSIFCLIMLLSNVSAYVQGEADCGSIFATLWSLYVCAGFTTSSFYVVIGVIKYFDYNKRHSLSATETLNLCAAPTLYCFGLFVVTFFLRKKLAEWFDKFLYGDEDEEEHQNLIVEASAPE